jgi:endogenous inhibitor of DNA gyrase (YacG/DUF329 family)
MAFCIEEKMKCLECGKEIERTQKRKGRPFIYCSTACSNRRSQRQYRLEHSAENMARQIRYKKDHPGQPSQTTRNWRIAHKEQARISLSAENKLHYAVKTGKIFKPTTCANCGKVPKRLEAHHYKGYDFPYDVIWLCTTCHLAVEKIKKAISPAPALP